MAFAMVLQAHTCSAAFSAFLEQPNLNTHPLPAVPHHHSPMEAHWGAPLIEGTAGPPLCLLGLTLLLCVVSNPGPLLCSMHYVAAAGALQHPHALGGITDLHKHRGGWMFCIDPVCSLPSPPDRVAQFQPQAASGSAHPLPQEICATGNGGHARACYSHEHDLPRLGCPGGPSAEAWLSGAPPQSAGLALAAA